MGGTSSVQVTVLATWGYFHKHEMLSILLRPFLEWWEIEVKNTQIIFQFNQQVLCEEVMECI